VPISTPTAVAGGASAISAASEPAATPASLTAIVAPDGTDRASANANANASGGGRIGVGIASAGAGGNLPNLVLPSVTTSTLPGGTQVLAINGGIRTEE
jgi:hypothetical protein